MNDHLEDELEQSLLALKKQQEETTRLQAEIAKKKEAIEKEQREAEALKPCKIEVTGLSFGDVTFHTNKNISVEPRYRNKLYSYPIPSVNGSKKYQSRVNGNVFIDIIQDYGSQNKLELTYLNKKLEEGIDKLLNYPNCHIDLSPIGKDGSNSDEIIVTLKYNTGFDAAIRIKRLGKPHRELSYGNSFKISLLNAWRVYEELVGIPEEIRSDPTQIVITKEVWDVLDKSIEKRVKLDNIINQDLEGEIDLDFEFKTEWAKENDFKLKNYQKIAIQALDLADGKLIVADEVGLGKTIEAIGYAEHINSERNIVLCPNHLKLNWKKHILNLTGYDPLFLTPSPIGVSKESIIRLLERRPRWLIINPEILSHWVDALTLFKPTLLIGDEVHYYKNTQAKRTQAFLKLIAEKYVLLTGTPVINRADEIWPMLHKVSPDTFKSETAFVNRYTNGKFAINTKELRENLRPLMIRRSKAEVVKELPPINRIDEIYSLSPKAQKIYKTALAGLYQQIDEYNPRDQTSEDNFKSINNILVKITRLKQICALDKAKDFTPSLATQINDSTFDAGNPNKNKVLIFTQFKPVAYAIARRLGHEAICSVELTNSGNYNTIDYTKRYQLVEDFQTNPKIRYLVTTEKAMGEGLDITAAGSIIFNDLFWTPKGHIQCEGRSHGRMSDLHSIDSHYIITEASIEEYILELLSIKKQNINEVVEKVGDQEEITESKSILSDLVSKLKDDQFRHLV